MKLSIIGCGKIARQHALPMMNAGFELSAVAGRQGFSSSVSSFADEFNINKKFKDPIKLIESEYWDALLLTCPTSEMLKYLEIAARYGKPILSEKPVSHDSEKLLPLIDKQKICVGFNRRFYSTVMKAKEFINRESNVLIKVTIPEKLVANKNISKKLIPEITYENSVHIFDILNFIAGEIRWLHREIMSDNTEIKAIVAMGSTNNGNIIQLDNYFNNSNNFCIEICANDKRMKLIPIEIAEFYEGMSLIEPNKENSIRTYRPILKDKLIVPNKFKPGFSEQANAFMDFCKNKKTEIAKIKDAYNAIRLIDELNS